MSIANVVLNARRATVAVDTAVQAVEGHAALSAAVKMLPLPSARSIVLGRGSAAFLMAMFGGCYLGAEDFDSLVVGMTRARDRLSAASQASIAHEFGARWAREVGRNELIVVGWSQRAGRIQGCYSYQDEPGGPFQDREIRHALLAPGGEDIDPLGKNLRVGDEAAMIEVARRQVQYARECGAPGYGGSLVIAHIDRDRIRTRFARIEDQPAGIRGAVATFLAAACRRARSLTPA
jgi:hypothetical protein